MKQINQKGFTMVEGLIVVLVLLLLGGGGWYVYRQNHKSSSGTTATNASKTTAATNKGSATPAPASPYSGWKTGTLQYEQVSYQYPADWTVTDLSKASNTGSGCVTPGFDDVTLTSPSDHQVMLHTGLDCIGDGGAKAFDAQPIKALGQDLYLVVENNSGLGPEPTAPAFACVAQTASADKGIFAGESKHITSDSGSAPVNRFCYLPYIENKVSTTPTTTTAALEGSADFQTAKLIFESMQYKN